MRNVLAGHGKKYWKETFQAYLFLLPSFVILGIFVFWPIGYSFVLSFFKWDFANQKNPYFNGVENYARLFKLDMPLPYSFFEALAYSFAYAAAAVLILKLISVSLNMKKAYGNQKSIYRKSVVFLGISASIVFIATTVFARMEIYPVLFLVGALAVFLNIWFSKPLAKNQSSGLWGNLIGFILLYAFLKYISGVRFELYDFLQVTKESSVFVKSIYNTLYYVILTTPTGIVLSLGIALLLNVPLKAKAFYRTSFFIPYITSVVAISLVWKWIFNDEYGMLNYLMSIFGASKVKWLTDEMWTIPTISIVAVWKNLGYNAIIFLAGLQSIDKFYYEAADVDGARSIQKFRHITWPLLSPTTFFVLIVSVIGNFKVFTQLYVLYDGLPGPYNNSGMTMVFYIFNKFYKDQRMGEASAAAYVLFMIIIVLTFFQFRVGKQKVNYSS